ncbi:LamG-like jellyroll fold domain-containing protein [Streptomyces calvus]|uniref:LamG-like jellyroll fold domain-containing protein n=1 Tax=Streptomyces calvus TaxID=67282 RepID=UPI0037192325
MSRLRTRAARPKGRRGRGATEAWTAAVCAAVVIALVPGPVAFADDTTPDAAPLSEGQRALQEAQASGQRVEVAGERTERTTVFANPDGYTFTLEESSVPVRVPAFGGWQKPDATLETRPNGTVGPKGAAVQMAFSGGGNDDPLARIEDEGRSLALNWPGTLPAPRLDGSSALYPEVLPDVDLKVTATPESFQHVLVVKTPEAAASEDLKKLTFGFKAENLTVKEGVAGNLSAVDGNGTTVFRAPPAQMWDSAGEDDSTGTQPQLVMVAASGTEDGVQASEPSDPAETAPSGSGLEPGQGDKVTRIDVEVGKDSLSVIPDADMLASTHESAFPVFIDPQVTWGESERTLLRSDGYESYGWSNGDDDLGKGVGECGTWDNYYCGPGYVQRLYFEFSASSLRGKQVLDATFRVTEPWAFQCDPRWVDLVRTDNISSSTTWSSRPKHLDLMGDRHVSAGRGSLCDPDSPDAPIEFNDNPEETDENLTSTVKNFAAGKFPRLTLLLKAHDESDTSAWKRFKNDAVLAVDFVGLPDKPSGIGLVAGTGTVCENSETDPAVVSDPTPALAATAQTKPGGEKDAQLRVYFDVDKKNDSTWADATAGNGDLRPSTGYAGDNTKLTLNWSTLTDGTLYRYRAWVRSYYNDGKNYLSGPSNASTTGWCYFKVDSAPPKAPTVSVGSPYHPCTANDCQAAGAPGVKATFTFAPAAGDSNTAYQYKLSSEAAWSAELKGTTTTADITPTRGGLHRLYVRARDSLGWGEQSVTDFLVGAGDGPIGEWHFTEADGAAQDSATGDGRDDATLAGSAARDDRGRRGVITHDTQDAPLQTPVTDKGLLLNGSTGYGSTSTPVVETRASYTLSAWVRIDAGVSRTMTALGQIPDSASPFVAKYTPFGLSYAGGGSNTWSLSALAADGTLRKAAATQATPRGVWTHVVGVHDTAQNQLRLYVNGKLQATAEAGTPWQTTGALQIGRAIWADAPTDYLAGSIDEVTVWQRALTPNEISDAAQLMNSPDHAAVELVADWSADRGSGSTIQDTTSGYGRSLSLTGGAALEGEAIVLDGTDDSATAAGPLADDTGSFTVTTLAALDTDKLTSKPVGYTGQVVGQRTADGSAWGIWYERTGTTTVFDEETLDEKIVPEGFWRFGRLNADGTFSAVASEESAAIDGTVRLTGVYNSSQGTISLYLSSIRNGDPQMFTAKAGSGDFAVGKGFTSGTWKHYLPARVTEVRMWAGAMATAEQVAETVGD